MHGLQMEAVSFCGDAGLSTEQRGKNQEWSAIRRKKRGEEAGRCLASFLNLAAAHVHAGRSLPPHRNTSFAHAIALRARGALFSAQAMMVSVVVEAGDRGHTMPCQPAVAASTVWMASVVGGPGGRVPVVLRRRGETCVTQLVPWGGAVSHR